MDTGKPPAEVVLGPADVRALLEDQHPDLAAEPLEPVDEGWDNLTFRLGRDLAVRLPRRAAAVPLLENEQRWLPELAGDLGLEAPMPVRVGAPSDRFPWPWSVVRWVEGRPPGQRPLDAASADRLGRALAVLHRPAPPEAPSNPFRGVPLVDRDAFLAERLARAPGLDGAGRGVLAGFWAAGLGAPAARRPTWIHGDLHPRNVVVRDGRLVGLLDWGDMAGGDPATDLAAAWTLLGGDEARQAFWQATGASDAQVLRARAWAVFFGAALACTAEPGHVPLGQAILGRLLDRDGRGGG